MVELAVVAVVVVELEVLEPPPHPASIKEINTRARGAIFFINTPQKLGININTHTLANGIYWEAVETLAFIYRPKDGLR